MRPGETATSPDVLDYYTRNWESIAKCYEVDENGLPRDVAWYRRRLYQEFLDARQPNEILDVGCGGGWTVLDALERGLDARGVEPVAELVGHGKSLLEDHGHDAGRIIQEDLAVLADLPDNSLDCVAVLSVLSLVPAEDWERIHGHIGRVLRPGGWFIAAYRNKLFDLFTFNSFTVRFFDQVLWDSEAGEKLIDSGAVERLKGLMVNPDVPDPHFTHSSDKAFGRIERKRANPLTIRDILRPAGLRVEDTSFYHFHAVPPLMMAGETDMKAINHQMEDELRRDWRGHFMAAMFVVEAVKAP